MTDNRQPRQHADVVTEQPPDYAPPTADEAGSDASDEPERFHVIVDGESTQISRNATADDLAAATDADAGVVFTYRGEGGLESLFGADRVAEAVDAGTELRLQPLGDDEVFGGR